LLSRMPEYGHGWAMSDVLWADRSTTARNLQDEMSAAVRSHLFGTIVTDRDRSWFQAEIESAYRKQGMLTEGQPYRMHSGAERVPTIVFVLRE
jgi:hypothetical protein